MFQKNSSNNKIFRNVSCKQVKVDAMLFAEFYSDRSIETPIPSHTQKLPV